jgi:oligoendopeptidase F
MKSPRAFCAPIAIPNDVRLVLQPTGGHQDYDTLLHEAGHAEHFANVDPSLPFAYKWLGDSSVTEGYAFLLHYLSTDPLWLHHYLDYDDAAEFRHSALFLKLQMLRRYATKLLYEPELFRAAEPERLSERYVDLFSHHLMVRYFPEEYLSDVDDGLYAAQYLRAWMFEAQLREYLKKEYDEEWFRSPRAGKFVRDLWREGQKYTADELAKFMGYDELTPAPLLAEIREALAR